MKMLARLKYLNDEGFEIASLSGYDDAESEFNAKILYLKPGSRGGVRVCSEMFRVNSDEMEKCCTLFFSYLSERN
jgi:hypothetical protein